MRRTPPRGVRATEFAKTVRDQSTVSGQTGWPDGSALGYARPPRSDGWLPQQPLPAVDGINAKIDGYGGGANHSNGFYGTTGALSVPLAQQWGLQLDGGVGSADGIGAYGGGGHLFWRDPSIGLLGAYGSYSHWNGIDTVAFGHISSNTSRVAAEGEYYLSRWTVGGIAGAEMVGVNSDLLRFSVPNRFFDNVSAAYYITDNFRLSAGHLYTYDTHFLTLGTEYGIALGGGRMASLFADGWIGERGNNGALAGLRIYFGQRNKTLIDRHRQDDPPIYIIKAGPTFRPPSFNECSPGFCKQILPCGSNGSTNNYTCSPIPLQGGQVGCPPGTQPFDAFCQPY
jgi:hypothetical protein